MSASGEHVRALDGLRAFAVGLVILVHVSTSLAPGGWVGVDIFFVLSGYLITSILMREHAANGSVSLRAFYMRRILRLAPALILLVAAESLFFAVLGRPVADWGFNALATLTYLMDVVRAFTKWGELSSLGHTWSLSVEEHFYILWPLLLPVTLRWPAQTRLRALIALVALLAAWRVHLVLGGASFDRTYYAFDTRADELLIGCVLACWETQASAAACRAVRRLWPIALAAILAVTFHDFTDATWMRSIGLTGIGLCAAVLVLELRQNKAGLPARIASLAPAVLLGRISYGIYLWHWPFILRTREMTDSRPAVILAVLAAIIVAWLSFVIVERPFLRLKRTFGQVPVQARRKLPPALPFGDDVKPAEYGLEQSGLLRQAE